MVGMGCDGEGGGGKNVWGLMVIGGAVKERECCYVAVDGKEFVEEIGGIDEAGKDDKTKELLARPLLHPV